MPGILAAAYAEVGWEWAILATERWKLLGGGVGARGRGEACSIPSAALRSETWGQCGLGMGLRMSMVWGQAARWEREVSNGERGTARAE